MESSGFAEGTVCLGDISVCVLGEIYFFWCVDGFIVQSYLEQRLELLWTIFYFFFIFCWWKLKSGGCVGKIGFLNVVDIDSLFNGRELVCGAAFRSVENFFFFVFIMKGEKGNDFDRHVDSYCVWLLCAWRRVLWWSCVH